MKQFLQVLRQKDVLDQQRKNITEIASKDEQLKRAFEEISALNKKLADQETESEEKARINITCSAGILERTNEVLTNKRLKARWTRATISHVTQPSPYACAQPCHLGSGSLGKILQP